jgi:hypothetical protein
LIIFSTSRVFLRDFVELSCPMHKDSGLIGSLTGKLDRYYHHHHSLSTIWRGELMVMFPVLRIAIILVMASTFVTAGLLPLASPILIQSAEATTAVQNCQIGLFGYPATIVATNNDDVIRGTEGNDVIVGLNGD